MTPIQRTLLAIFLFIAVGVGLFIWFIANWDKTRTQPIGTLNVPPLQTASLFSVPEKSRGSGGWPPVQTAQQAGHMT